MRHIHIDNQGRFQSDKHPELPPDKVIVAFDDPLARPALAALALAYNRVDHGFASDIRERLSTIAGGRVPTPPPDTPIGKGT